MSPFCFYHTYRVKNLSITHCSPYPGLAKRNRTYLKQRQRENCLQIYFQRAKYVIHPFIRLAEPSVITTSTDAREWKDRSSKRQIDMSSIRHDGRVLSSRKRYACTFATFAYARAFAPILQRPQAHPRYSLTLTLHASICVCVRARTRALAAYIIVRLISVINILRTAITRGPACSRDINYG